MGGTNHFAHSGRPADKQRVAEYETYKGYGKKIQEAFAAIVPPDADAVADAIVKVVDAPFGKTPVPRTCRSDAGRGGRGITFAAIAEEKSITAAASRLLLSQPAVSRALQRARMMFQTLIQAWLARKHLFSGRLGPQSSDS